ncbi:MAG: fatty acid desaturase [Porphyromonadaceae bacterium CG2_30_38_12]|nr:MAG: fatty acid desaturase [Porphyromonadaceae bacterium CG2_30_38_12]
MGLIIAFLIVILWFLNLLYALFYQTLAFDNGWVYVQILLQTWLFTGLFITAHDAMHGTVSKRKSLNFVVGFVATFLFAAMNYRMLLAKHKYHHDYVGTASDPDYKTGNQNFFLWWFSFLKQYVTILQVVIMAVLFNVLLLRFDQFRLLAFWILPSVLATFQLFYFGTYTTHKLPHTPSMEPYKSRTLKRNHFVALITCYFFGYHYEHHQFPGTPWWKLYQLKK